jgi:hypothetical protein
MEEWAMSSPRVKVLKDDTAYLNQKRVSHDELLAELLTAKGQGFGTYFYREAALSDPQPPVKEIYDAIISAGIPVRFGNEAPSEWGELETFMLVTPSEFHFAISKDGTFTFVPEGGPQPRVYHSKTPHAAAILREVDALVSANRVIETPPNSAEKAMVKETATTPSLQVVVQYAGGKLWRSYYPKHQVPDNIKSLLSDCRKLGLSLVSANRQGASAERA